VTQEQAARQRWANPEYRQRQAEAWQRRRDRQLPTEPKVPKDRSLSASERNKKLWQDPEYRAKQTEARRRNWDNPDYRARSKATRPFKKGSGNPSFKHGASSRGARTVEFTAYHAAKGRCTNPNGAKWADYGGRGIQFLFTSFEQFLAEVGLRPSPEHSLDRWPNNDGNYEPGNVRWATKEQQVSNRRPYAAFTCGGCGAQLVCEHCRGAQSVSISVPDDGVYADL
jgi:hypothetical protein